MKIIYCDCRNGFSNNSFLAALLAAGLPLSILNERYQQLACTQAVTAHTKTISENGSDSLTLIFEGQAGLAEHAEGIERPFSWQNIIDLFTASQLPAAVRVNSLKVLERLAAAIPRPLDFHSQESNSSRLAVDQMIVELVGVTSGLDYFKADHFFCSPIPIESNADAVILDLLIKSQVKVIPSDSKIKPVSPIEAAILAEVAVFESPGMTIHSNGCGADSTCKIKILVGETKQEIEDSYVMLETNLDDMPGLAFGSLQKQLILAGAWDVYFTPIQMKKNRPGFLVNVFTTKSNEARLANLILRETSTFGIRAYPVTKYMAERNLSSVETMYGKIRIKIKIIDGKAEQGWPEYEDCAVQAENNNVPFLLVYQAAQTAAQNLLN